MVNYYVYAKDFSGSTEGNRYYHSNGLKTFEQFKDDVERMKTEQLTAGEPQTESKIIYLHWGDKGYEVDECTIRTTYAQLKSGNISTEPESIVKWIQKNISGLDDSYKIKLLYIITDGLIEVMHAKKCFQLNANMHYETVVFHAINENPELVNLSVAASFFKSRCIIYRNSELLDNVDISGFDYDRIKIFNLATEKDNMLSYIKLKFINSNKHDALAMQEIDKLKKLRDRLFQELLLKSQKTEVNLNTRDINIFFREFVRTNWYKNLNGTDSQVKADIDKFISTLINYIYKKKKTYSFDALKFNTTFNKPVEEELIVDVNFAPDQQIEFPDIILDDDKGIPVVILTELNLLNKIIFHTSKESVQTSPASFSKFKSTMECPLFLLNDPDISESIGYFYTLNVYKQLLVNNNMTEPRTRRPFHGGLVLTDTDEFDKYNDYVLSATYFDSKKIKYNIGLFYFVLWKNCENKEWMDKNVVEQFKKYTMRRISTTVCKIGLSSLPLDPQENTSLLTALWYCVELSSCIFKDDPQNFMHERLRMFCGIANSMTEILNYFNYDLDLESIKKRTELISNVMVLKKIPRYRDKVYYLLKSIFKTVEGFLVCEIENPSNVYKLNYLKFHHKALFSDAVLEYKVNLNDYVHFMYIINSGESKTGNICEICEKTFRPFFAIDQNVSFYTELVKITKQIVINNDDGNDKINITYSEIDSLEFSKILSLYNTFIKCVIDFKRYPTLSEYIEYISKKKKFNDYLVTIFPPNVYIDAKRVYLQYQKVLTRVDVDTFIKACKTYVKRSERIKAERILQYDCENKILDFISNQELKVNFKNETVY